MLGVVATAGDGSARATVVAGSGRVSTSSRSTPAVAAGRVGAGRGDGVAPGNRRPPKSPPADSANWVSGPRRFDMSVITSVNCLSCAGSWPIPGVLMISDSWRSAGAAATAGPLTTCITSSASLTVRVICGIAALIGSSTSPSNTLIRCAVSFIVSIVRLKFSTPRRNSSTPLRNWSNERIVPASGAAKMFNTSESGSERSSPVIAPTYPSAPTDEDRPRGGPFPHRSTGPADERTDRGVGVRSSQRGTSVVRGRRRRPRAVRRST